MIPLLRFWLDLCLMRAAPQDGPASSLLLAIAACCYFLASAFSLSGSYGLAAAWPIALTELLLLAIFVTTLLYLFGMRARVLQTLSALTGAGCIIGVLSIPLVILTGPVEADTQLPVVLSLAWLALLAWNLGVTASIMRHALSRSFAVGLGVALVYMVISMQIITALFAGPGNTGMEGQL